MESSTFKMEVSEKVENVMEHESCCNEEELTILTIENEKDSHLTNVVVNRLPCFDDFIWEKFAELDPSIDAKEMGETFRLAEEQESNLDSCGKEMENMMERVAISSKQEKKVLEPAYFWLVGTNEKLKMKILYFIVEDSTPQESVTFMMKDKSQLILDHHFLYLDVGSIKSWVGDMISCTASDPKDPELVSFFYLY
jgi:hypothetical protein